MLRIIRNLVKIKLKLPRGPLFAAEVPSSPRTSLALYSSNSKSRNVYLLDEDETSSCESVAVNKFTRRTHTCGQLTIDNVGETVTLSGWLEYQRMNKFVILRDSYGETQLLIKNDDIVTQKLLEALPFESIIRVEGVVLSRPADMKNAKQKTGDVEVLVDKFSVLNKARSNSPFNIREFQKANEALRMQYRYLDLRFPFMQRNLRVRSEMLMKMREFLVKKGGFVDVETPTLFKATPGGAQEFVVPTRFPGQFYSLVQSPQQFKQMLMAGAVDRYFQIARCYRDEGARSDRQPEFTQLDIEMSFTSLDGVLGLIEEMLGYSWPEFLEPLPVKFDRISFKDALEQYGSDQPDVRFEFKLQNCTEIIARNSKLVTSDKFGAYCVIFSKELANLGKKVKDSLIELSKQYPLAKLVQSKLTTPKDWVSKMSKLLSEEVAKKFIGQITLTDGCVMFLAYGDKDQVLSLLGKARLEYADYLESLGVNVRKKGMHLLWVVDFPLFEPGDQSNHLKSPHHPFTSPHPEDLQLLDTSPLQVRGLSYDLVLNGNEIGGGSIRIHDPELQEKILKMLDIEKSKMQHIIEMLGSGCPPHGGIALGLDRLMSKILKTTSIRDVMAFPKTFEGRDPLSGAPSPISEADQKLYHIKSIVGSK